MKSINRKCSHSTVLFFQLVWMCLNFFVSFVLRNTWALYHIKRMLFFYHEKWSSEKAFTKQEKKSLEMEIEIENTNNTHYTMYYSAFIHTISHSCSYFLVKMTSWLILGIILHIILIYYYNIMYLLRFKCRIFERIIYWNIYSMNKIIFKAISVCWLLLASINNKQMSSIKSFTKNHGILGFYSI